MSTSTFDSTRWVGDLARFTDRNSARTIDIEVFTAEFGAQPEVRQLRLQGAAFDRRDGRIDIMMGGADHSHLTHSIGGVKGVEIMIAPRGMGDILSIEHEGGRTIIRPSLPPSIPQRANSCSVDL